MRAFDHDLLPQQARQSCRQCHQSPQDRLHRKMVAECSDCHSTERWTPASFDHSRWFRFDRHHPADDCALCHVGGRYDAYTCYGCHEHSESKVRREHLDEGIRDFANCVACHRSGDEHEAERMWRDQRRSGERRASSWGHEREHDDDDD
ncbi:putative class III cytochrome C family protein [Magnetofaba australis IT-1]|uniref:Putative class III cytochrome C family protein n=1 Tax=Magnetofaba australis IT-1 TaxID=1434232 RepID=A0A1Y2K943_9PROT|nr:putative class III cytochrome C family protein [Magnetofaba australis IT-1]